MTNSVAPSPPPPTVADRIHAIVAVLAPKAAHQHAANGSWPNRIANPRRKRTEDGEVVIDDHGNPVFAEHSGAPYVIMTLPDGGRRLSVIGDDGDVLSGSGATLAEAVAALEAKIGGPS